MHSTQTFVLRLFVNSEGAPTLKGMLRLVREDAEYPFESEEELLVLIRELTNQLPSLKGFVDGKKEPPSDPLI